MWSLLEDVHTFHLIKNIVLKTVSSISAALKLARPRRYQKTEYYDTSVLILQKCCG